MTYKPTWFDPQDCPHSGFMVCHDCDRAQGWYFRDRYPDCPWRVTEEEIRDPHRRNDE